MHATDGVTQYYISTECNWVDARYTGLKPKFPIFALKDSL